MKAKITAQRCGERAAAVAQDQLRAALQMAWGAWRTGFNSGMREVLPQGFTFLLGDAAVCNGRMILCRNL